MKECKRSKLNNKVHGEPKYFVTMNFQLVHELANLPSVIFFPASEKSEKIGVTPFS